MSHEVKPATSPSNVVTVSSPVQKSPVSASPVAPPVAPVVAPASATPAPSEADKKFAQLASQEKALRNRMRAIEAREKAIQEREAPKPQVLTPQDYKKQFMQDPLALGFTPEELRDTAMSALNTDPQAMRIRQLEAKLSQLEQGQNKSLETLAEQQKNTYDQAVKQLTMNVTKLVDSNEAFETVKATRSQDAVVQLIEQTYKEDGILLSAEEAATQVEEHLLEEALTLAKLKKVQAKLAPPPIPEASPETKQQPTPKQPTQTLTHKFEQGSKPLTAKDRRERAIAAFRGESN